MVHGDTLITHPFFEQLEAEFNGFFGAVYDMLRPALFVANDYALRSGEINRDLFFIIKGGAEVVGRDGCTPVKGLNAENMRYEAGGWFNELAFLVADGVPFKLNVCLKTTQPSQMYYLLQSDYQALEERCSPLENRLKVLLQPKGVTEEERRQMYDQWM